ncbi:uncharacterized protein LOC101847863 isoform X2 [Aplysia californica]|uniref:Uncharacterized protein LOC101847863 isoform X2 n=1 Tax=Aplysia californica TaxID=6500 RepID=A0ABM0JI51_APLCA|nr:uncharacterized protein LOC101847863 isoform X2 [Aplysia californica]
MSKHVFLASMACCASSLPTFCKNQSDHVATCLKDAGLEKFYNFTSAGIIPKTKDLRFFCDKKKIYATGVDCMQKTVNTCSPNIPIIFSGYDYGLRIITGICNDPKVNVHCYLYVNTKNGEMRSCISRSIVDYSGTERADCAIVTESRRCVEEVIRPCDEHTAHFAGRMIDPEVERFCRH